ncbi:MULTISPECIES: heat-inducible transcriptional repressor HrcA [Pelosinus]|uniref:Heat-inducible transcription repressor HrcA n=1 Tax=Pelosinus fermentans B4 TaxID=1149862 RepID=I9LA66_9FIRM|nr:MULTISPECIES: heat-inducible transcriptional repressor HrcA [Pelosinus]EIW17196.1 heat-inducible transcription repressor HrcA [Pelosinus fermentans B4]EIW23005.1 heat-inducible transcription repressor HrcA [Pelosinus fermentans A11]OAM93954.1 heat-inducible transcription repressor HrcA [Pelosinus fermentans DSM 17108]SDQ95447.1 heat-inducible transcription repressor HrcA [Pelosinus fermentans]
MLDKRKRSILQAIVDDYISTAEPIGSRTIARKHDLGVSPATIRNEMADLELLGYIEQLHTSSGRIPSAKGYRFYVDSLLSPTQMSEREIALIKNWYQEKTRHVEEVFQETAKILSKITSNISLVLVPQVTQCAFKYLKFLPFDDCRTILVVVTDTGFVENKVIDIPTGLSFNDLQRIAEHINRRLSGLSFENIELSILREIQNEMLIDVDLFETALGILKQALVVEKNERLYLGGTTQLLSQPEFKNIEKVKSFLDMLEEEHLLANILQNQKNDGVIVTIGDENKYSGIQDCSMVQATYRIDGQVVGTVAVLGPTRMDYGKVMSVLEFMHNHLGEVLKKYKI